MGRKVEGGREGSGRLLHQLRGLAVAFDGLGVGWRLGEVGTMVGVSEVEWRAICVARRIAMPACAITRGGVRDPLWGLGQKEEGPRIGGLPT